MDLDITYRKAYESITTTRKIRETKGIIPSFGFTSNLDILCTFNIDTFNQLLNEYYHDAILDKMKKAVVIRSMRDFLSTVVYYCANGIGGESDIHDFSFLSGKFGEKYGMGGTGVQAALALSKLGIPSLVHLTDDSKEVCNILACNNIYTIDNHCQKVHTDMIHQAHEQEIHYIIQFKKGDLICLGEQKLAVSASNRLILTKVTVNATVPFSKQYFEYVEKNADKISSCVFSSFNCILDQQILAKRLDEAVIHAGNYRKNNPNGIVYFEDAAYHSSVTRRIVTEKLYPEINILGINEEELASALQDDGKNIDQDNINSCIEAARYLRQKYLLRDGVIVHTKDYSMYVGNKIRSDIKTGLIYGNLLATSKALRGWYGSLDDIKEVMHLKFSSKGLAFYHLLENNPFSDVILIPTKYIEKPKYTIGLGDSFVGGLQICFLS